MSCVDSAVIDEIGKIVEGFEPSSFKWSSADFSFDEDGRLVVKTAPSFFEYLVLKRKDEANPWSIYLCCSTHWANIDGKSNMEFTLVKVYGPTTKGNEYRGIRGVFKLISNDTNTEVKSRAGGFDKVIELPNKDDSSKGGYFTCTKPFNLYTLRYLLGYMLNPHCDECFAPPVDSKYDELP